MSKGNPFLAVRLSRDQQDALSAKAAEYGVTLSDLVRQAVADYVAGRGLHLIIPDAQRGHQTIQRRPRKPSRPARLQHATGELEDLLEDYETWQANLPESLQDTATAAALAETIDSLQQAVEQLQAVTPPRGFGRD